MDPLTWAGAIDCLGSADPSLVPLFERYTDARLTKAQDPFRTIANAIVGQQISVKAADAIWKRLVDLLGSSGGCTPESVVSREIPELRQAGLSQRKAEYLHGLAQAFVSGRVNPDGWDGLPDEGVVGELVSCKGIGPWTADMVLIFLLNRPDILPLGDIALVRAGAQYFNWALDENPVQRLRDRGEIWRPWRSVASWFLWRTQDAEPIQY